MKSRALLYAGIAIVAIIVGALSAQLLRRASPEPVVLTNGTALPEPRALPAFTLLDHHAQTFKLDRLKGHWSILFFGYTNCPDVCPTTLTTLAQVDKALQDLSGAQHPQIVFISVDPKRDTPTQLASYVHFFNPQFIGVTGEQAELDQLTHNLGVPVEIHDNGSGAYTVDHSAVLFLVDPQARMTAVFSPPHQVAALADDVRKLITGS